MQVFVPETPQTLSAASQMLYALPKPCGPPGMKAPEQDKLLTSNLAVVLVLQHGDGQGVVVFQLQHCSIVGSCDIGHLLQ